MVMAYFKNHLGFHYGAQKIGTTILPISGNDGTSNFMKDSVLQCYVALQVMRYILQKQCHGVGINPKNDLKLKMGLLAQSLGLNE